MTRDTSDRARRSLVSARALRNAARSPVWLAAAIPLAWYPLLTMPGRRWSDFASFYAAGSLAFGPGTIDERAILAFQQAHGLAPTPFLYPPAVALLYVPFAWLAYDAAGVLNVALQAAALLGAALLGSRVYGIPLGWAILGTAAWAPAAVGVITGQNSALFLLLTVAATAALAGSRWRLAGVVLGAATYRPQLGFPLVALAGWRRAWGAGATVFAALAIQYVLGIAATGGMLNWPAGWARSIAAETPVDFTAAGWQALSLPGMLSRLSLAGSQPGSVIGPALAGYAVATAVILRGLGSLRSWDAQHAVALACTLALFAGPRGWSYDGTMLLPAVAVLAREAAGSPAARGLRRLIALAYLVVLCWPLGASVGVNPEALVVLAAPFVLLRVGSLSRWAPPAGGPPSAATG